MRGENFCSGILVLIVTLYGLAMLAAAVVWLMRNI